MRLFIALELSDKTKNALSELQSEIKKSCVRGNFSSRDNFHITLAFIGEAPPSAVSEIKKLIASTGGYMPEFSVTLDKTGVFHRDGGDILWVGAKLTNGLYAYRESLADALRCHGFDVDGRFTPHITLSRQTVFGADFKLSAYGLSCTDTAAVRLFKSERVRGVLTYTAL